MRPMYILAILLILASYACVAQTRSSNIEVGFADIQTVSAAKTQGGPQHMTPGILVRIFDDVHNRETFVLSNVDGIAVVPLRPGSYCLEAFGRDGHPLMLDERQSRRFDIKKHEDLEVGVVVRNPQN